MAELPPPTLTILYPPPPPFYKEFKPENIAKIEVLRAAQSGAKSKTEFDPATSLPARILDLPPELRCLQPPEPPADGFYRCFGINHTVCIILQETWQLDKLTLDQ
jgi:mediator of RNA polymerase II transcription subunit 7